MQITEQELEHHELRLHTLLARLEPANVEQVKKGKLIKLGPNEISLYVEVVDDVLKLFAGLRAELAETTTSLAEPLAA